MEFVYIGEGHETSAFGYTFPKGEPVEVEGDGIITKLSKNPCFAFGDDAQKDSPKKTGRPAKK